MAAMERNIQPCSESVSQMQEILQSLKLSEGSNAAHKALLQKAYDLTRLGDTRELALALGRSNLTLLGRYGFEDASPETRHLSLRCLHNLLHQALPATQMFIEEGFLEKAVVLIKAWPRPGIMVAGQMLMRLQSSDSDDEFLGARLLIVCTNHSAASLLPYLELGDLADTINANIARHANLQSSSTSPACDVNLSLLSLLASKHEAQAYRFADSLGPILTIWNSVILQPRSLEPPVPQLISCLVILTCHGTSDSASRGLWPSYNADKLVAALNLAIPAYQHQDLDDRIQPLVALLLLVAASAPDAAKERLKTQLLPSAQDRTQVLGKGDSLPHRLVKISTETVSSRLKLSLASLLLELSDRDPRRLVDNLGYGCAVGLLHCLETTMAPGDLEIGQTGSHLSGINPITGQLRDRESHLREPPMTDEEKEREAERLLKRTGVVNVENPVAAAMRSGQLEELPDEDVDEGD